MRRDPLHLDGTKTFPKQREPNKHFVPNLRIFQRTFQGNGALKYRNLLSAKKLCSGTPLEQAKYRLGREMRFFQFIRTGDSRVILPICFNKLFKGFEILLKTDNHDVIMVR